MKSQSSTEFLIFVGIAIIIMMAYLAMSHTYLNLTYKQRDIISGQDLAKQIKNEINLAARVEDNYRRTFQLPYLVGDKEFKVHIKKREVSIKIDGLDYTESLMVDISNGVDLHPGYIVTIKKTNGVISITEDTPQGPEA